MTTTMPLTKQFIELLAKEAGGEEYGPRTWNMSFKRDALHRFADAITLFCENTYLAAADRDGAGQGAVVLRASLVGCPFCGADETKVEFINSTTWCYQRCKSCGATGPRVCAGHGGDSKDAWNRRASLKAVPEVEVVAWQRFNETIGRWLDTQAEDVARYRKLGVEARALVVATPQPSPDADGAPDFGKLTRDAVKAVEALYDYADQNESMMDAAWDALPGDSWQPLHMAEFWRIKSGQALKALAELPGEAEGDAA